METDLANLLNEYPTFRASVRAALHQALHDGIGPLADMVHEVQAAGSDAATGHPQSRWPTEEAKRHYEEGVAAWHAAQREGRDATTSAAGDMANMIIRAVPSNS